MNAKVTTLFFAVRLVFAVSILSSQQVLEVPSQFKTIQDAINAAKDKDTVLVAPGLYKECIDFEGKRIKLVGRDGPASTVIDGKQRGSVVTFQNREDLSTELTGFTIMGGKNYFGGGINCNNGSPTIYNNIIRGNTAEGSVWVFGGGIHAFSSSSALIINNLICFNVADPQYVSTMASLAAGGGISAWGNCLIANNIIFGNRAFLQTKYTGGAGGGAIYSRGNTSILNNTIFGNYAFATSSMGPSGAGGGVNAGGSTVISNCIIFANKADYDSQINALSVEYSCIEGGFPGRGNISSDPQFVDSGNYDFHIRHDSPCRNKGSNVVKGLPGLDFDGDPRIVGGTVDMGADEYFPHLYYVGSATPGGKIDVKLIGNPNELALWGFSSSILSTPLSIPGLNGLLHLNPGNLFATSLGQFPSKGVLSFSIVFPGTFPQVSIPTQALIGIQLSNLSVVHVR